MREHNTTSDGVKEKYIYRINIHTLESRRRRRRRRRRGRR